MSEQTLINAKLQHQRLLAARDELNLIHQPDSEDQENNGPLQTV